MAALKCKMCGGDPNLCECDQSELLIPEKKQTETITMVTPEVEQLLKQGAAALQEKEWCLADRYFENVLNRHAECVDAYVGKLLAELHIEKQDDLKDCAAPFDGSDNYQKALRFADDDVKATLTGYIEHINICNRQKKERKAKRIKKILGIAAITICATAAIVVLGTIIVLNSKYSKAAEWMESGKYDKAITAFQALEGYRDSTEKVIECNYAYALDLLADGNRHKAAIHFGAAGDYKDAKEQSLALWDEVAVRETLSAGFNHTVGLKADGTVVAVGDNEFGQCNVSGWTDIVAISAGDKYTVGLKADGTVVAVGDNYFGQCDVNDWTDIVAISAAAEFAVGLKADGTVVAAGQLGLFPCAQFVSELTNIIAISAGALHVVGLKSDGTVVAVGRNIEGQCNVSGWTDIVAVSAHGMHTVGLKFDGTVVAVGSNNAGQCNVSDWEDIVAIHTNYHTVGLKADGTVVAVGNNIKDWYDEGQFNVSGWQDIVAIGAGSRYTVGLKSDGTVVAVGRNKVGQCNVSDWTNIRVPG